MSSIGNQRTFQGGCIMRVARATALWDQAGPYRDIGQVEIINPELASTTSEWKDARGGKLSTYETRLIEAIESFTAVTQNVSPENLAYAYGADDVVPFSQSATPLTDVPHVAWKDGLVPLVNAVGLRMYNIASIGSVATVAGSTALVLGTDYYVDEVMLKQGVIEILPTSTVITATNGSAGQAIKISFTPVATTTSRRQINPQTADVTRVLAEIEYNQHNYTDLMMRDGGLPSLGKSPGLRLQLSPATPALTSSGDVGKVSFGARVIEDPNSAVRAGRLLYALGTMPRFASTRI